VSLARQAASVAEARPQPFRRIGELLEVYRKEYLDALRLLSQAFDIAESRGASRPVIVGGSAVEYYTAGEIISGDFDLVTFRDDIVGEALMEVGFRREDRRGIRLGGFYHPELLIGVEFVSGALFDGRTDRQRLQIAIIDERQGAKVIFPPLEDMIADRLAQYASAPEAHEDMLEQASLLTALAESLDTAYLRRRACEEGADPGLVERLLAENPKASKK
jgi:hypothetical protein